MKILRRSLFCLFALLLVGLAVLWTPDTSKTEMRLKYATPQSQFIELGNGDQIHFRDQGVKDLPVLLLVHGTSASLHTWEPLIARLADRYRLVSLDLPGHGLTGAMQGRDYSVSAMVDTIWLVMEHLKIDTASLVGNSLGGRVAWHAALNQPKRVNTLILLAPSGAPRLGKAKSNIGFKLLGSAFGQAIMKRVTPRFIIEKSLKQTMTNTKVVNDSMIDRYWELLRMEGNRQAMIDLARTSRNEKEWQLLKNIATPTLLIWGEDDSLLPRQMSKTFEAELQHSKVVMLPDVGHIPMEESVSAVAEAITLFCRQSRC